MTKTLGKPCNTIYTYITAFFKNFLVGLVRKEKLYILKLLNLIKL